MAVVTGLGIGIVEIWRIQRLLDRRPRSLRLWFSPEELERTSGSRRAAEDLAGRYASKLAVRKALQSVLPPGTPAPLREIILTKDPLGKPCAALVGRTSAVLEEQEVSGQSLSVSITHSREYAAALAILLLPSGVMESGH